MITRIFERHKGLPFVIVVLLLFSIGANLWLLILFVIPDQQTQGPTPDVLGQDRSRFPYLSQRIFLDQPNDLIINFSDLRQQLREYVRTSGLTIGFYFEYLPSGTSIGVNDTEPFATASLIKVPTVMAVYKKIEEGTLQATQELVLELGQLDEKSGELWKRGAGARVRVAEAIHLAIADSDNTAYRLLVDTISIDAVKAVYDSLDVPRTVYQGNAPLITPKSYTSILRSLYLSSYLNFEHSNEILKLMDQSQFRSGLVAGVPGDVAVSHKFGVVNVAESAREQTFSDCGIIFVPKRPYALCMMVKNADQESAVAHTQSISQMVYDFVSQINH